MLCTESLSNITGNTVVVRGVFVTWVLKRNLDEEHQRVRKTSKAHDVSGHEYRWQRMKFSVLATDVWAMGKENCPKGEMKWCIVLEIATSQIDARWNQMCEAWQDAQEMFTLSKGDLGYVPDWLFQTTLIQRLNTLSVQPLVPLCLSYFLTHTAEVLMRQLIWAEHPIIQL